MLNKFYGRLFLRGGGSADHYLGQSPYGKRIFRFSKYGRPKFWENSDKIAFFCARRPCFLDPTWACMFFVECWFFGWCENVGETTAKGDACSGWFWRSSLWGEIRKTGFIFTTWSYHMLRTDLVLVYKIVKGLRSTVAYTDFCNGRCNFSWNSILK